MTIIGARPQFIKAAVVSMKFASAAGWTETIVHTGQHFDKNMSEVFFDDLGIPKPWTNLGIASVSHGAMTGDMLKELERIMMQIKPDVVMVYGDTNSTLAGALAASKLNIPIAHIEAGLRSFNRGMPEEINRVLTDHCSELLFTPTDIGSSNLANEGIDKCKIHQSGDVMFDAAIQFGRVATERGLSAESFGYTKDGYVLATIHRQENTSDARILRNILLGFKQIASTIPVVLPIHPRTRIAVENAGMSDLLNELNIVNPTGFLEMIALERDAAVIATDSGGVQKEAFFHHVPCVTLRNETEWLELIDTGWNTLSPPISADVIAKNVLSAIGSKGIPCLPYGDGSASERIVSTILDSIK